ncbi:MAG: DUF429 domain-containing protein [Actinomycetales bacterium]|nr:DUF429 domain-containing protein [Actinomycetales bacterium]
MRTAGVDLAAEALRTAVAVIEWHDGGAHVAELRLGVSDDDILATIPTADVTGIDCPFGWPDAFVDLVVAHRDGSLVAPASSARAWRRPLTMRATDLHVHATTGLTPLSVSADRIAHAALRLTAILATLESRGVPCARDGSARVVEAYPAAALQTWGLPFRGYKRGAGTTARAGLVDRLQERAPWLELGAFEQTCCASDDALDAVVCALIARAAAVGHTVPAPDAAQARREGWIHLPTAPLATLATP